MSFVIFLTAGCSSNLAPRLAGSYQSIHVEGYIIQIAVQPEDNTFIQYIDSREVNRGVVENQSDNMYVFEGTNQVFEVTLSSDNTFEVSIAQISDGEPIELENISEVPTYSSTKFDDVEEYEELLNEK